MKIKLSLAVIGVAFSYALIILRSSLDAMPHEYLGVVHDDHHVIVDVDSQQLVASNTDIAIESVMQRLMNCMKALEHGNSDLINMLEEQGNEYLQGRSEQVVIDHNFVIDALPSKTINELEETVKLMVGLGFEKECTDVYTAFRREWLEDFLLKDLLGIHYVRNKEQIDHILRDLPYLTERWSKVFNVSVRILFPTERRLCDRVFSGFPSAADLCFLEVCQEAMIQLLKCADAVASGSPSKWRLFGALNMFETLCNLFPEFQSFFPKWLVNEAVLAQNRLGEASRDLFIKMIDLIFRVPMVKGVAPASGGLHPLTTFVTDFVLSSCLSRQTLEQIFQEYPTVANGAEVFSFSTHMDRIMKLVERKVIAKSKVYKDPALRYLFMMNNRRYIAHIEETRELGAIFGKDWFKQNSAKVQQNLENYQRSSWDKLLNFLEIENYVTAESMIDQLDLFNKHFKEICRVQSTWRVSDKQVRVQIITSLESTLLPAYGNFIGTFQDVVGKHAYVYIKYGMLDIQDRLNHLFVRGRRINEEPKAREVT